MLKFCSLPKLRFIVISVVILNYSLWSYFFILQGKAIDLAIQKNNPTKQLLYTLVGFILIKMVVMICDVFQKFMTEYYKNIELKHQWSQLAPTKIDRASKNHKNKVNILFFDYLPRLFDTEITITKNRATLYYIFTLTLLAFLYTGFLIGFLALLLVFALSYLSKNVFTQRIDDYQIETNHSKLKILNWVDQYFNAYREISKNWPKIASSSWKDSIYHPYYRSKHRQTSFYLYRDLLAQVLVELPFLLNTSVVILGVYYGYLSLTELFVWVGFSQFMINASNAYLDNRVNTKQRDTLIRQSNDILSGFKSRESEKTLEDKTNFNLVAEVTLRDGSRNTLSLKPGIYRITGENGSGKSTLLNIILDYEHDHDDFENINLSRLTASLNQERIRVIERDLVIFECLEDINSQILGPLNADNKRWEKRVSAAINHLLGPSLSKQWMEIFIALVTEYAHRRDKTMSSGERIILSLLRFFASWNTDVNLLIIDECDSFLDSRKKRLFIEAVHAISAHMAVYICSHEAVFSQPMIPVSASRLYPVLASSRYSRF